MRKTSSAVPVLVTALTAILLGLSAPSAQAQRRVQLIDFTATSWRYETNGTDLMTAWRARTFVDTGWPAGMGLLGVETTPGVYPYPFNTMFPAYNNNIITYYFRAHFNMSASDYVWPLTLVMSNLVDDGCVVYLNGNEVNRIRVPAGQTFTTPASGGPLAEGGFEAPVNISTNGLLLGDNVIAVEVHQTGTGSSDIVNGLSLTAVVPTTITITSQPPSQTSISVGQSAVLTVGTSGGPALFQWQTNNGAGTYVNVPGATAATYNYTPATAVTTIFRAVVSNGVNMVISSTATVTATADTTGPVMLSAIVLEEPNRTNRIQISWNDNLLSSTANLQSATNFTVVLMASNVVVGVSNVQYNPGTFPLPGIPPTVILTMSNLNWHIRSNYCIRVNNVRDGRTNVIAPNSRICVSWPSTTNVMQMSDAWDFFDSYFFVPDIYTQPWMATNYVPDFNNGWGTGSGILYKDPVMQIVTCAGDTLGTAVSIQNQPTLFRRSFMLPTNITSGTVQLKLRYVLDDGAVFYLNGKEMLRVNMPGAAGTPVIDTTLANNNVANPTCVTNDNPVVPADIQFFPGMNWMAVAVCQGNPLPQFGAEDVAFGLEMDVRIYGAAPAPTNPVPRIFASKPSPTTMRMFWTNGFGYAVVSATTPRGGPWTEVQPNLGLVTVTSNTTTVIISNVPTAGPTRFYRLRKAQLQ